MVDALPSCRNGRRCRSPHSAGVLISFGRRGAPAGCRLRSRRRAAANPRRAELRFRLNTGFEFGPVVSAGTWQAAQPIAEDAQSVLATTASIRSASERREEPHERLEVVDAATTRDRIAHVFRIGPQVAAPDLFLAHAEREFLREEIVGDPHFIAVGVAGERQQRRLLRLPSEAADAAFAGRHVGDDRGASDDAVAVAIERVFECEQRFVRESPRSSRRQTAGSARGARRHSRRPASPAGRCAAAPKTGASACCRTCPARRTLPQRPGTRLASRARG